MHLRQLPSKGTKAHIKGLCRRLGEGLGMRAASLPIRLAPCTLSLQEPGTNYAGIDCEQKTCQLVADRFAFNECLVTTGRRRCRSQTKFWR